MKTLVALCLLVLSIKIHAALPDLTGTYTGCGEFSSLGKRQAVLVLVKMPTGFAPDDFRYTAGFYWKEASVVGTEFFTDVQVDEASQRILMRTEIKPLHDFGIIAKSIMAQIQADGSIAGEFLTNATGSDGQFQNGRWTVQKIQGHILPTLNCSK